MHVYISEEYKENLTIFQDKTSGIVLDKVADKIERLQTIRSGEEGGCHVF